MSPENISVVTCGGCARDRTGECTEYTGASWEAAEVVISYLVPAVSLQHSMKNMRE